MQAAGCLFALLLPFSSYRPLTAPAFPDILGIYVEPALYLSDLALAAFVLTGVPILLREGLPWPKAGALAGCALYLAGLAMVTAPFALVPSVAGYAALRWLLAAAVSLRFLQGDLHLPGFVKAFLIGLVLQVLVSLGQVVLQRPLGLPGEMALPLSQPGAAVATLSEGYWLRAYGLTFHPNVLGGFLVVGLLLALPLLSTGRRWIAVWWLLWGGLLLTLSRSAALAALVTVPLALGWWLRYRPRSWHHLLVAAGGVALLAAAGAAVFWQHILARLDLSQMTEWISLHERGAQFRAALGVLAARPLAGVGAANFPLALHLSGSDLRPLPVHNVPLLLASEVGVLGGAIWLVAGPAGLVTLIERRCRLSDWAVAGLFAWLALWVVGLFDYYPWGLNAGQLLSAAMLGLSGHALLRDVPTED